MTNVYFGEIILIFIRFFKIILNNYFMQKQTKNYMYQIKIEHSSIMQTTFYLLNPNSSKISLNLMIVYTSFFILISFQLLFDNDSMRNIILKEI